MEQAKALLDDVTYVENPYDCADGADALVIATEWEQFRALDLDRLHDLMACPVVIDLRNVYRSVEMSRYGFAHTGVGRPLARPIADMSWPDRDAIVSGSSLPARRLPITPQSVRPEVTDRKAVVSS
jgi:hypothetical protein